MLLSDSEMASFRQDIASFRQLNLQEKLVFIRNLQKLQLAITQISGNACQGNVDLLIHSAVIDYLGEVHQCVREHTCSMSDYIARVKEFFDYGLDFHFKRDNVLTLTHDVLFVNFLTSKTHYLCYWLYLLERYSLLGEILGKDSGIDGHFRLLGIRKIIDLKKKYTDGRVGLGRWWSLDLDYAISQIGKGRRCSLNNLPIPRRSSSYTLENRRGNNRFVQAIREDNAAMFMFEMDLRGLNVTKTLVLTLIMDGRKRILSELFSKGKRHLKIKMLKEVLFAVCEYDFGDEVSENIIRKMNAAFPGFVATAMDEQGNNALWHCLFRKQIRQQYGRVVFYCPQQYEALEKMLLEMGCDPHQQNNDLGLSYAMMRENYAD